MHPDENVTMIVRRQAKAGREAEFEAWQSGIAASAARFPGHMGETTLRLPNRVYVTIFRFDTYAHLHAWERSDERRDWLRRAEPLIDGDEHLEQYSGIESWFTLPDLSAPPPPKYKMAVVTYLAITPLVYVVVAIFNPPLAWMHPFFSNMITSVIITGMMTWVIMPRMTRWFRFWLYPEKK